MQTWEIDKAVIELLGGAPVLGVSVKSFFELALATREGLPEEAAAGLLGLFSVAYIDWNLYNPSFWKGAGSKFGPIAAVFADCRNIYPAAAAGQPSAEEVWAFVRLDMAHVAGARRLTPEHSDIVRRTA